MNVVQQLQAFLAESVLRTDEETAPVHLALGRALGAPLGEPLGFEAGLTLQPAHLAILAAANVAEVPTRRPAGIGLVSIDAELSGNEADAAATMKPANAALAAATSQAGQFPIDLGVVPDHSELHHAALERALALADIVCSIGPTAEQVRELNDMMGGELRLLTVGEGGFALLSLSVLEDGVWFGLPGEPAEALAAFQLFVLPLAKKVAGHHAFAWPKRTCRLPEPLPAPEDFAWTWARLDWSAGVAAAPLHQPGRPSLSAAAQADGLLLLSPSAESGPLLEEATFIVTR